MLMLNIVKDLDTISVARNSNTTYVNVKLALRRNAHTQKYNSNTTYVNVKQIKKIYRSYHCLIQIQPMLMLNL